MWPRMISLLVMVLTLSATAFLHADDAITIPSGQVGQSYDEALQADGGRAPFKWKVVGGQVPPGLHVRHSGEIMGTPVVKGTYNFVLQVSQSSKIKFKPTQIISIVINPSSFHVTGTEPVNKSTTKSINEKTSFVIDPQTNPKGVRAILVTAPKESTDNGLARASSDVVEKSGLITVPTSANLPLSSPPDRDESNSQPAKSCGFESETTGLCGGQMLRTIIGFEQAGVSGAQSKQDFFFDVLYDRPIGFQINDVLGPALRGWGNLQISSVPQQIATSVAQFSSTFAQQVGQLKVNEVAQSFEFLGGIKYRLYAPDRQSYAGPDDGGQHRISVNFVVGGGIITPLSPKDSVQIFNVPSNQPSFLTRYPEATGKQFVAFALQDRNRFFRQAYGGLRLETHYLQGASEKRFPETFDVTYGFDEAVTGGRIHGGVLRLEGFVPIPYAKASWIYLFGTGIFKPGGPALNTSPFLLDQAPAGTLPTDSGAVVISTPQANRDYYRVGVGIDFINLVGNWKCNFSSDPSVKQSCGK
jgi:hypothetical protein